MSQFLLVQYGRPGYVGRFAADEPAIRGERVVVRGPRGVEVGEVLCAPAARFAAMLPDGDVLRAATDSDRKDRLVHERELLELAESRVTTLGLPLTFVDCEITLDNIAILHALPWDACDATPLLDELTLHTDYVVRLLDLSRAPGDEPEPEPASAGCGKPGCGSSEGGGGCGTGGGCSTGACSRGAVKNADDLTAYFADLRVKMEAPASAARPSSSSLQIPISILFGGKQ